MRARPRLLAPQATAAAWAQGHTQHLVAERVGERSRPEQHAGSGIHHSAIVANKPISTTTGSAPSRQPRFDRRDGCQHDQVAQPVPFLTRGLRRAARRRWLKHTRNKPKATGGCFGSSAARLPRAPREGSGRSRRRLGWLQDRVISWSSFSVSCRSICGKRRRASSRLSVLPPRHESGTTDSSADTADLRPAG